MLGTGVVGLGHRGRGSGVGGNKHRGVLGTGVGVAGSHRTHPTPLGNSVGTLILRATHSPILGNGLNDTDL